MRGFEGFLFSVALPALFVGIFSFAISDEIRKHWRKRGQYIGSGQDPLPIRKLFIWTFVSVWISLMSFVVYRGLRIHYDLWVLSRRIVEKLGFLKLRVAPNAATHPLDGAKLDRHESILTSPDALPDLDVSWG